MGSKTNTRFIGKPINTDVVKYRKMWMINSIIFRSLKAKN